MMTSYVLDSSAVLASLFDEPGGEGVAATIAGSVVSAANYAEIIAKLVDKGVAPSAARQAAAQLRCEVASVDETRAGLAGLMLATTRGRGISLGDRFCLALALELELPVLTAD